jgi:hypothetical protein
MPSASVSTLLWKDRTVRPCDLFDGPAELGHARVLEEHAGVA